jgi:hypothetical protein
MQQCAAQTEECPTLKLLNEGKLGSRSGIYDFYLVTDNL